jgi:hypothetical protein
MKRDREILENLVKKYGKDEIKSMINESNNREVTSWKDFEAEFDIISIDSTLFKVLQKIFKNYGIILTYGTPTSNQNVTPLHLKPEYEEAATVLADFTYLFNLPNWSEEGMDELAPGIYNFISKPKTYAKKLMKDFDRFWDFEDKLYNAHPYHW